MLGWEYPPAMAGGLGVASAALARELSNHVDLRLVTPGWDNLPNDSFIHAIGSRPWGEGYPMNPYPEAEHVVIGHEVSSTSLGVRDDEVMSDEVSSAPLGVKDDIVPEIYKQASEYAVEVVAEVADKPFDIIHVHDWLTALPGLALREATGKPLVLHVHALEYDRSGAEARGWIYTLECEALEKADTIIPVSQYMASILIEHYGIDASKIKAIPHGGPAIKTYSKDKTLGSFIVTFVGRLANQKNPYQVLDLAEAILQDHPDITFVLAGDGPEAESLLHAAIERGLELNIMFTGFLNKESLHDLLAMSDIFFMPSWSEPFGLAAVEAATFGVPCLLSDRCGAVEILRSAWVTAPDDTTNQANLLKQLIEDESLRNYLGTQMQEEAKSFSWQDAGARVLEVYRALGGIEN